MHCGSASAFLGALHAPYFLAIVLVSALYANSSRGNESGCLARSLTIAESLS